MYFEFENLEIYQVTLDFFAVADEVAESLLKTGNGNGNGLGLGLGTKRSTSTKDRYHSPSAVDAW